jgi:RimJ/RimL family protein N-acetyltransferase
LRPAGIEDAELLRSWKNANREGFFFKAEISPEAQATWMAGYLERPADHIFVVEWDRTPIGCMGVRIVDGKGDVYNVILGEPQYAGQGLMSLGLRLMLEFARSLTNDVGLKVLKGNAAIRFYERNGFGIIADHDDHLDMAVDWARVRPLEVHRL